MSSNLPCFELLFVVYGEALNVGLNGQSCGRSFMAGCAVRNKGKPDDTHRADV
jgi:hypothetical protein